MVSATPSILRGQNYWQELFGPPPDPNANWSKHFRLGALVGFNLKGEFSMSGQFSGNSNPGGSVAGQNHSYDDGYVNVDATGNDGGMTWNWGYQSSGQNIGSTLQFHTVQSYETSGGSATVDGDAEVGIDLAYGGRITRMWGGTLGWEFGFGWLPIEINNNLSGSANVTRLVHSYDTFGIELPGAPYQGGFNGPGATISDTPVVLPNQTLTGVPLSGSQTLDLNLYNFRLGPTLQWELHPRIAVAVSACAAFGIVGGGLKYNETLAFSDGTTANNSGEVGDTQFVYGGYLSGTFLFHAVQNGDIYLGFQYMPMSSATFSGDGREGTLDLTGALYISAGINWPF